jgi:hypothetical protein
LATVRKNQKNLSSAEWTALVNGLGALRGIDAPTPQYSNFVRVHVNAMAPIGMAWGVHSMAGMVGRNFLAWHRWYLRRLERRLQQVDPSIVLPYWDVIGTPQLPPALNTPALLASWGISRNWNAALLPTQGQLTAVNARTSFDPFQHDLEQLHNSVHNAVGGTMGTSSSPADPLFWLHHANIDRLWAKWQQTHSRARPTNVSETLQPPPLIGRKVSSVLGISVLGYKYA